MLSCTTNTLHTLAKIYEQGWQHLKGKALQIKESTQYGCSFRSCYIILIASNLHFK